MGGTILTHALRSYGYLLAVYSNCKHLSYLASSNNYSYFSYLLAIAIAIYVTRSEKSRPPRTQQQDTLFTIKR